MAGNVGKLADTLLKLAGIPLIIGSSYYAGFFYRGGKEVLTLLTPQDLIVLGLFKLLYQASALFAISGGYLTEKIIDFYGRRKGGIIVGSIITIIVAYLIYSFYSYEGPKTGSGTSSFSNTTQLIWSLAVSAGVGCLFVIILRYGEVDENYYILLSYPFFALLFYTQGFSERVLVDSRPTPMGYICAEKCERARIVITSPSFIVVQDQKRFTVRRLNDVKYFQVGSHR